MTKKIILLLVEGPTDEDALALVYSKLVRKHDLEFIMEDGKSLGRYSNVAVFFERLGITVEETE